MQINRNANVEVCQCASITCNMQMCKYADVQICKCACMQMRKYASKQMYKDTNVQVCKCASMQVCKYANVHPPPFSNNCLFYNSLTPKKSKIKGDGQTNQPTDQLTRCLIDLSECNWKIGAKTKQTGWQIDRHNLYDNRDGSIENHNAYTLFFL